MAEAERPEAPPEGPSHRLGWRRYWPWLFVALAVLLIAGGIIVAVTS